MNIDSIDIEGAVKVIKVAPMRDDDPLKNSDILNMSLDEWSVKHGEKAKAFFKKHGPQRATGMTMLLGMLEKVAEPIDGNCQCWGCKSETI